ncbi:phosphoinositide-interacting protein-like [Scyliorhinus torazame]|uniref:phosphoinositide-interacting protein-like n=1 Tax=Scyliorhinus torazame TaxID=75743 RepID=UPI003B591C19
MLASTPDPMMTSSSTENTDLGIRLCSESKDLLTSHTGSTYYSSSRSVSIWTSAPQTAWEIYHKPIFVMSVGGAFFFLGSIMTGLYFAQITKKTCNVLGPAFLSIGMMFLVFGLVWLPILKEKRKQKSMSRYLRNHKPPSFFNL